MAIVDRTDPNHSRAMEAARALATERVVLVQTADLQVESHGLLVGRVGHRLARQWLLSRPFPTFRTSGDVRERAVRIVATHADKSYSLCDAISFAFMEAYRIRRAFAFDRHFRQFGRFEVMP